MLPINQNTIKYKRSCTLIYLYYTNYSFTLILSLHGLDPFKDKPYSFQKLISLCIYLGSVHFVSIVCRAVSNNMHYLHWICEPGTLLCFSVLDTDAFRGVFGDLFSQRVLCTTSICVAETQPTSFWLSHLGLSAALKNESPCLVLSLHND